MAASQTSVPQTDSMKSGICTLCLGTFTKPKLLPCFHTFCEDCLKNLAARHHRSFPCPVCRTQVKIPGGGASAFQTNFYIDSEDLRTRCVEHPTKQLDLYCLQCKLAICVKCLLAKHQKHDIQDIAEAAEAAKNQLSAYSAELGSQVTCLEKYLECFKTAEKSFSETKSRLQREIHAKHAKIVAAASKYRDQMLTAIEEQTKDIKSGMSSLYDSKKLEKEGKLEEVRRQLQQLQHVLGNSTDQELVKIAKNKCVESTDLDSDNDYDDTKTLSFCHLELHQNDLGDSLLEHNMRDVVGTLTTLDCIFLPKMIVIVHRQNSMGSEGDIYFICPLQDGSVALSYESPASTAEQVNRNGASQVIQTGVNGRVTFKHLSENEYILYQKAEPTSKILRTFAKSETCLLLESNEAGAGRVFKINMSSKKAFTLPEQIFVSDVNCSLHRAFDANREGNLFVVLEMGQPENQRSLKLYQSGQPAPLASYAPPVQPFQPSDVCFYTLGGQEVLLVADELNSSIHVVKVQAGQMHFMHYLIECCPLFQKPTALNTDKTGCLWVACKGGRILMCTPVI